MEERVLRDLSRGDAKSDEVVLVAEVWLLETIARLANIILVSFPYVVPVLDGPRSQRLIEIGLYLEWWLLFLLLDESTAKLELGLGLGLGLTRNWMYIDYVEVL